MTEFKNYPREYEYVFSDKDKIAKKCSFDKISFLEDTPKTVEEYIKLMRGAYDKMEKEIFDSLVKIIWLEKRFYYNTSACNVKGIYVDHFRHDAYKTFMLSYVGKINSFWTGTSSNLRHIVSYFEDFFPHFLKGNPFEGGYEYPYQYINFEDLNFVYQMPERLELLSYGDSKKMKLTEFFDYVLNYINCYNDKHGDKIYEPCWRGSQSSPFIKYIFHSNKLTGKTFYIKNNE